MRGKLNPMRDKNEGNWSLMNHPCLRNKTYGTFLGRLPSLKVREREFTSFNEIDK